MGIKYSTDRASGFTIIELIVVLLIVLLGMTVVGANFSKVSPALQLKTVGGEVVSALRFARTQAVSTQQAVSVRFNLYENTYQVQGQQQTLKLPEDLTLSLVILTKNYAGNEIASIIFYKDGSSSGAQVLLELDNHKKQIEVNWLTGKITRLGS
ncbi:MAG TPA: prepilin-type N-terminal cleavage/methylation domain-containing protein [Methylococcaceae bacterium]|nr:prepilin-type N-terminal cleavage/methylation domain-containing protein [Methylococcaceae bacterium]HIN68621.1 prepilin-type N-terminal cleavage/methylation domain-containing protein [Methylococcales bacterium]HIA46016.1 prepilin-type N-terminal cleavage/methylation domain-containing protein [Methylococcaceae bacterium]HIB63264.1 prepilin-type N-terminal cleavage/methylation domain-containing protein [Methylococcaceae bacterium]HIO13275.1 prepilin-type N-terminal cleavage/methylation domain-